jgi:hypothetical protein
MHFAPSNIPLEPSATTLPPRMYGALILLLRAYDYALEFGCPAWDFAVEIQDLLDTGLTNTDLRWLVCQRHLHHAAESAAPGEDHHRVFGVPGGLTFTQSTCFILTASGAAAARRAGTLQASLGRDPGGHPAPGNGDDCAGGVPHWDSERKELRWWGQLVKRFTQPAPNQEAVLAAFEEEGWPPRIDNPLHPRLDGDLVQRLHDTIIRLNRHQERQLLRFRADGSGQGVRWEAAG